MVIDAEELLSVRLSLDGRRLRIRVRDKTGGFATLSLPSEWLNELLKAVPRQALGGSVHRLDSWSMDRTCPGGDLVLTLRTPKGQAVSFAAKAWQFEGMATVATFGAGKGVPKERLH
jgi:hypothetical protein